VTSRSGLNPPLVIPAPVTSVVDSASIVRRWVAPGLGAGAAFLAFEMLVGCVTTAAWAFPQSIAQTIGLTTPTTALDPSALLIGMTIHMAFSVGLGVIFIALAQRLGLRGAGRLLVAGVLFMWVESAVSIWASIVGRTSFGLVLARRVSRERTVETQEE
jgi:hypothetical protein